MSILWQYCTKCREEYTYKKNKENDFECMACQKVLIFKDDKKDFNIFSYLQSDITLKEVNENNFVVYIYEGTEDDSVTSYMKPFESNPNTLSIKLRKSNGRGDNTYHDDNYLVKYIKAFFKELKVRNDLYNIGFPDDLGEMSKLEEKNPKAYKVLLSEIDKFINSI